MQSRMLPIYVYWDISRVLHTVILPWIDKSYPDQQLIILLVLLYMFSKSLFRRFSLLSISIPNIVKSCSQLSLRSWQMFSPSKTPTGITLVFPMLHFRPDISQKWLSISTDFLNFFLTVQWRRCSHQQILRLDPHILSILLLQCS